MAAFGAVVSVVADGELTPDEAALVVGLIEAKRKTLETSRKRCIA
jgi:hypothetical protein